MRRYTEQQHAWMADNWRKMTNAEVVHEFEREFGEPLSLEGAKGYGQNRRWRKDDGVRERAIVKARGLDIYTP